MNTYPTYSDDNKLHSFQIDNARCGRIKATEIVESIPGVTIIRKPVKILSWFREEIFCEFQLDGVKFHIDEPYGDNSMYWIGSVNNENSGPIEIILEAFNNA